MPDRRGILFVISAPSGGGKTSLCKRVVAELCDVVQSVSYTTRAPRPEEQDGREYHFVARQTFEERIACGAFLEWAEVHGHLYGTSREQIEALTHAGTDVLLAIDVQGAAQLRTAGVEAVSVFVVPPSWETLEARLQARGSEAAHLRAQRLLVARQELTHYTAYNYLVINDDLPTATAALKAIILAARHCVRRLGPAPLARLLTYHPPAS